MAQKTSDMTWRAKEEQVKSLYRGIDFVESRYLKMKDGVRLAIDVYLPKGRQPGDSFPTILYQTRYFRSVRLRSPLHQMLGARPLLTGRSGKRRRAYFVERGYAWVDVDVRGSGASFGTRICPWSPDEITDGAYVVDWILQQDWSNGEVGSTGISYSGTTSEFLLLNRHPAVKAIIPRFSLFDTYADIAFPGGIRNHSFLTTWSELNHALDHNDLGKIVGSWVHALVEGVSPVAEDRDRRLRTSAVSEHAGNYNVHEEAMGMCFRDDISPSDPFQLRSDSPLALVATPHDPEGSIGLFSPHNYTAHVQEGGVPIFNISGWYDGAYAHGAIKRFLNCRTPGSRLLLGPWNHGGGWQIDPLRGPSASQFDHDLELLLYFNQHLGKASDTPKEEVPAVMYYTLKEGTWKTVSDWPPPGMGERVFYMGSEGRLVEHVPEESGYAEYKVDPDCRTMLGKTSRWKHQAEPDVAVFYPPRSKKDTTRFTITSEPLEDDVVVTGHPLVQLFVSSTATDGHFFAYLEEVDMQGRSHYVTEGMLRALHRKIQPSPAWMKMCVPYRSYRSEDAQELCPGEVTELLFDLLPVSYRFTRGHRIRLAITGADKDHFPQLPEQPPTLQLHFGQAFGTRLILPVEV